VASRTDIANLALGHFGQYRITDIDQNDPSAEACRDCWQIAADSTFRAHHWNFATADAVLVELEAKPLVGWSRQFVLPGDFRRLVSCNGVLAGTRDTAFAVRGQMLVTDAAKAEIEYVRYVPETDLWDGAFVEAFSFALAELIAPRLTLSPESAARLAERKRNSALTALTSDAVETRPPVRRAEDGSRYAAARWGLDPDIG